MKPNKTILFLRHVKISPISNAGLSLTAISAFYHKLMSKKLHYLSETEIVILSN